MAIGEIAKQLATQALLQSDKPAAQASVESVSATIAGQVQAMQKALKEDEELVVLFHAGAETIRVLQFFVPSPNVVVLSGVDAEKNTTRIISAAESLQLVCKVMKVHPPAKPTHIGFASPKPKPE